MAVQQAIGQKLRELRQQKGLTQKELALKIQGKVDYSYIGKIERGEQLPSLKVLKRLSDALMVPLGYFFQGINGEATAKTAGRQGDEEVLGGRRQRLLLRLVRTVHNDDIPLLLEIVRILNKHRKAHRMDKEKVSRKKPAADSLHAAEDAGRYKRT